MVLRVSFPSSRGPALSALINQPHGHARGWGVFAHGFALGKDSPAAARICRQLASEGIGMLRFDNLGLGESGGDRGDGSFTGDRRRRSEVARRRKGADAQTRLHRRRPTRRTASACPQSRAAFDGDALTNRRDRTRRQRQQHLPGCSPSPQLRRVRGIRPPTPPSGTSSARRANHQRLGRAIPRRHKLTCRSLGR